MCDPADPAAARPAAYSFDMDNVVLCPRFDVLPPLGWPCNNDFTTDGLSGLGSISKSADLLQNFLVAFTRRYDEVDQVKHLTVGDGQRAIVGTRFSRAYLLASSIMKGNRLFPKPSPGNSVSNYVELAKWAWDLGLGLRGLGFGLPRDEFFDEKEVDGPVDVVRPLKDWPMPPGSCLEKFQPEANEQVGEFPRSTAWLEKFFHYPDPVPPKRNGFHR